MPAFPHPCASALLVLAVLALPGCDRLFEKGAKGTAASADKKVSTGDFRGAVRLYEDSLDGTAQSAETHYKLALVYADKLRSPLDAVHHCDRYLELAPSGAHAKDAKSLKKESENKVLIQLSNGTPTTQAEAIRLKNENQMLLEKLATLRAQRTATPAPVAVKGELPPKPAPPGSRTYTVKAGDTLAKISRQFYKNSVRARDIQAANSALLGGTEKIKPGMVLVIPK